MTVVYTDVDPLCCIWLQALVDAGALPSGEVVRADIRDVAPSGRDTVHWFAGIGGWARALELAGWPGDAPVWTGSCPCQPFSQAGRHRGEEDERHLWPIWREHIAEQRPAILVGEQVASPAGRDWLSAVRADLEALGYAVGAADLCAAGVGAPHVRQRLYWMAHTVGARLEGAPVRRALDPDEGGEAAAPLARPAPRRSGITRGFWADAEWWQCQDGRARPAGPGAFPLAHGVPARVGRLRGYGNAIVPPLAAAFLRAVIGSLR